ncbi:protein DETOXIFICATION 16-like [Lolium rigidum]|uniref:protein DETOXIFICATION 16-like n=1 Tax=Lolium rigidum TaxID=89674 RepID=UPI001F5D59D0|nr:protein DETOXIFICATION 16-like [Lolium rigidum]XP_047062088.1 protein DETOXIFICATION 16-like [Lolium rigidum]XP_047062089.1 protein DETOXIFICATION 16-like [Lolium rigidum]
MVPNMEEPLVGGKVEKIGGPGESLVVIEVKKQLYLAGPLIVGSLLQNIVQMMSVMFVGHLGELSLSSASIATSFAGVTGFSLLAGMSTSLDTLCGQAFGAKQYYLLGIYKQRAILVFTPVSVVVAVIWVYTGQILLFFGQDPEIAMGAGSYIRWLIPALFVYGPLQCHVRFLQTQNIVLPVMLSSGVTALNHMLVCWLLVYKLGLGNKGAALANTISYLTNLLILALYIRISPSCKRTWTGLSMEAFRDIVSFFRLAVPSALMVCLEWWSFELLVLLSGFLPNPKLEASVLSISLNTISLVFRIPSGLSAAISTRVSNELGAGQPNAARLATQVIMVLGILSSLSVGLLMILVRNLWGYAYSNEKEVVEYISRIMPILAVTFLFDDMQCILSGIVRGCGFQKIGAYVNLSAYYLVGIPAALCFAFVYHLGGVGLWSGITCGLVVQTVLLLCITLRTNWDKEALKAKDRVFSSSLPVDLAT